MMDIERMFTFLENFAELFQTQEKKKQKEEKIHPPAEKTIALRQTTNYTEMAKWSLTALVTDLS